MVYIFIVTNNKEIHIPTNSSITTIEGSCPIMFSIFSDTNIPIIKKTRISIIKKYHSLKQSNKNTNNATILPKVPEANGK